MLPKGFLVGFLTADPQIGVVPSSQNTYARFSVACVDPFSRPNSTTTKSHFFNCVAWGKKAQFIQNYLKKGDRVFIEFIISTGSYVNSEGRTIKTIDLIAENIESLSRSNLNKDSEVNNKSEGDSSEEDVDISPDEIYA